MSKSPVRPCPDSFDRAAALFETEQHVAVASCGQHPAPDVVAEPADAFGLAGVVAGCLLGVVLLVVIRDDHQLRMAAMLIKHLLADTVSTSVVRSLEHVHARNPTPEVRILQEVRMRPAKSR